jgi:hypothetical protein
VHISIPHPNQAASHLVDRSDAQDAALIQIECVNGVIGPFRKSFV